MGEECLQTSCLVCSGQRAASTVVLLLISTVFAVMRLSLLAGIELKVINDYINSAYRVGFSLDRQFPATPLGVYMLDIILNGAPMAGSPFAVRVDPGPVFGPNCEITGLTNTDASVLSGGVNELLSFEVVARDLFGNRQVYSDKPEQWTIEIVVVKGANLGQATVIKVPLYIPPSADPPPLP